MVKKKLRVVLYVYGEKESACARVRACVFLCYRTIPLRLCDHAEKSAERY